VQKAHTCIYIQFEDNFTLADGTNSSLAAVGLRNSPGNVMFMPNKLSFFYLDYFLKRMLVILQDELARVFVSLFDAKRLLYQLLWNMFSKEVTLLF
jgi:hypothetical protein